MSFKIQGGVVWNENEQKLKDWALISWVFMVRWAEVVMGNSDCNESIWAFSLSISV